MHLINLEKMISLQSYRPWLVIIYLIVMFSNSIFSFIDVPIKNIWKYDKTIHFIEYFILGVLLFHSLFQPYRQHLSLNSIAKFS